jgi:6-phosphogluconolactonase
VRTDAGVDATLGPLVAYVSGYAPKLSLYQVTGAGTLGSASSFTSFGTSPSFLAVNPAVTNLYALDEATVGRVGAYAIDKVTGALAYLDDVSSGGNGPAHVSVDATGQWVFVANYGDGTTSVLPVQAGGSLGAATDTRSVGANAHMMLADPSNQYVFVPCLGADYVAQFRFDATTGKLTPNTPPHFATAAGAGPRHVAFHPNGKLAYLIAEKASTLSALSLDTATGLLTEIETLSTLPAGFSGSNTGAEVWVHPSGTLVFGSNRGDDSIVTFAIDASTGKMTLKGHTKTGGTTPRDFTIAPSGAYLYVANQGSGTVTAFAIDVGQGTLAPVGSPVTLTSPSFVGLVHLPAP